MQVPMSPVRILKRAVKLYGKKTAVVDGDLRLSYAQVNNRVNRVIHAVQEMKIPQGGRIAMLDYNTYRYMELYFGMAASGCVLSPLNTRLSADEYIYILKDSEAEAIIFHCDFKPLMAQVREAVPTLKRFYIADGKDVLKTMQDEKMTATMMVPTMINFLLDLPELETYNLESLAWTMVGGAPMSPVNAKRTESLTKGC